VFDLVARQLQIQPPAPVEPTLFAMGSLWTWAPIVIAHIGFREAVAIGEIRPVAYRMPGSPNTNWPRHCTRSLDSNPDQQLGRFIQIAMSGRASAVGID
jgi:hypothetical protein